MNSKLVLYSTALIDNSEYSIDIKRVYDENLADPEFRSKHSFTCPCCGSKMMAVLGNFRERHFRHELATCCDPNYYLHSTAEQVFYEEYNNCLREGRPFVIKVFSEKRCVDTCAINDKRDCPKRFKERTINLTEVFSKITPETRVIIDGRYRRPDLLLESETGKQLWVEIWVSHRTEESKRRDGDILELKIVSEEDILKIRGHNLTQQNHLDDSIRYYLNEECQFPEKGDSSMLPEKESSIPNPIVGAPNSTPEPELNNDTSVPSLSHSRPIENSKISLGSADLRGVFILGIPEFIKPVKPEWIDLGLPSRTLWSKEYLGSMSFDKAQECYPGMIPSPEQYEELINSCKAIELYPAGLIGPNGVRLDIYEGDFWTNCQLGNNQAVVFHREFLSKFAKSFNTSTRNPENHFEKADRNIVLCVRLAKRK